MSNQSCHGYGINCNVWPRGSHTYKESHVYNVFILLLFIDTTTNIFLNKKGTHLFWHAIEHAVSAFQKRQLGFIYDKNISPHTKPAPSLSGTPLVFVSLLKINTIINATESTQGHAYTSSIGQQTDIISLSCFLIKKTRPSTSVWSKSTLVRVKPKRTEDVALRGLLVMQVLLNTVTQNAEVIHFWQVEFSTVWRKLLKRSCRIDTLRISVKL